MRVLALDTTTRAGSVALVEDDHVIAERRGDPSRTHAERLPHDLLAMLAEEGLQSGDVDLFAVASGPGSFTGLRVGIATLQGFAFVHRRPIVAVSALEALAQSAGRDLHAGAAIGVWTDAHRRDVFTALYRIGAGPAFTPARLNQVEAPAVGDPAATLLRWARLLDREPILFAGDAAVQYGDLIRAQWPDARLAGAPPLAGVIGRIAEAMAKKGETNDPADIRPLYVRRPDAEVERERRGSRERSITGDAGDSEAGR
jgi:tRNA threonylcarbamoyladenosine biosynthesis protein TsaB